MTRGDIGMQRGKKHINPWIKIIISIAFIAVFMTRNYFLPPLTAPIKNALSILGLVVAIVGLTVIFKSISELSANSNSKLKENNFVIPNEPVKIWTRNEVFDFLEQENVIDLLIYRTDNEERLLIGVSSDHDRRKDKWINKIYLINELEYSDLNEFKEAFVKIHPEDAVRIMRVSIGDGQIIINL